MTQAQILYWLEGKPQIGQDTGGRGAGSYVPVGESQTVGGSQPSVGSCSHLDRVHRTPRMGGGALECGMSQTQRCKEKLPSRFCAVGTRCFCWRSAVTPLRHLVGASQVCGVLFLYFQVSLRPAGSQSASKGGPMPCPLIATRVGFQGVVNTMGWG